MALDYWKLGGLPSKYNPLPVGQFIGLPRLSRGDYIFSFTAYSPKGATLRVSDNVTTSRLVLTTTPKVYSVNFLNSNAQFWMNDEFNYGDIVVSDINIVQKPLPKLTINGISGDVADWEQGTISGTTGLNGASTTRIRTASFINVESIKSYYFACKGYSFAAFQYDANKAFINNFGGSWFTDGGVLTTAPNARYIKLIIKINDVATIDASEIVKIRPMLNLGSTVLPYEPKKGEKMYLPKVPKRVPKKNFVRGESEQDVNAFNEGSGTSNTNNIWENGRLKVVNGSSNDAGRGQAIKVKIGTTYIFNCSSQKGADGAKARIILGSADKLADYATTFIPSDSPNGFTFTAITDTVWVRFLRNGSRDINNPVYFWNIQLEEGTTATPYEPYTLVNPKARSGLMFDGVRDYLQLPSMTMDAIEIECSLDVATSSTVLLDARNGLANGYIYSKGSKNNDWLNSVWKTITVNDVELNNNMPLNQRVKVKATALAPFTDDVTVFARFNAQSGFFQRGTLYKVTCYLNGAIVAQYDFEKASNIIGNQVIPNAQNLIPSFEDTRWNLHANAKVLGNDMLRLDATGTYQSSSITVNVLPNTNYFLKVSHNAKIFIGSPSGNIQNWTSATERTFNSGQNNVITIDLSSSNLGSGTFDFIRPQLYQLSGKEGTLYGSPVQLNKSAKRQLYAKR